MCPDFFSLRRPRRGGISRRPRRRSDAHRRSERWYPLRPPRSRPLHREADDLPDGDPRITEGEATPGAVVRPAEDDGDFRDAQALLLRCEDEFTVHIRPVSRLMLAQRPPPRHRSGSSSTLAIPHRSRRQQCLSAGRGNSCDRALRRGERCTIDGGDVTLPALAQRLRRRRFWNVFRSEKPNGKSSALSSSRLPSLASTPVRSARPRPGGLVAPPSSAS